MQPYPSIPPPPRSSGRPLWVWLLAGCGGLFCMAVVGLCYMIYNLGNTAGEFFVKMDEEMRAESKALRAHDARFVTYEGNRYLVGTVQNTSKTDSFYGASVSFTLFDRAGADRGMVADSTSNVIKPGKVWRFKIAVADPWATRFVLDRIDATKTAPTPASTGP